LAIGCFGVEARNSRSVHAPDHRLIAALTALAITSTGPAGHGARLHAADKVAVCASGGAERRWRLSASRAAIGALPLPGERDSHDVEAVDALKMPGIGCSYAPSCGDGGRGYEPVVRSDVLAGGGELGPEAGVRTRG
jgi:hypothetical protein